MYITMTSEWARWRLKTPVSWLFTKPFIQAQIKENIKGPRHWPMCGEFTASNAKNVSIWWRHHEFSTKRVHCYWMKSRYWRLINATIYMFYTSIILPEQKLRTHTLAVFSYVNSVQFRSYRLRKKTQSSHSQLANFMGPTWRPPGSCRPQTGPMLAPWTLLSGFISYFLHNTFCSKQLLFLHQ